MLQPSCSLANLPLSTLQPLTVLRSLQLPCAPRWLLNEALSLTAQFDSFMSCSRFLHLLLCDIVNTTHLGSTLGMVVCMAMVPVGCPNVRGQHVVHA